MDRAQTQSTGTQERSQAPAKVLPFEETFICPRCNRPLALYVQAVHLEVPIDCPRCGRSLTNQIRRAIQGR